MSSYFGIKRPEQIECKVTQYKWGGGVLHVQLKRQNSPEVQYLKFRGVEYFAGPLKWMGADFKVRSISDCLTVLQKANCVSEFVGERYLEERGFRFYIVELPESEVHIIANSVNLFTG